MDLKNKSTTELHVIRQKLDMELSQRRAEKERPVIRVIGEHSFDYTEQHLNSAFHQQEIIEAMKQALDEKDRAFNIKLLMVPESDFCKIN